MDSHGPEEVGYASPRATPVVLIDDFPVARVAVTAHWLRRRGSDIAILLWSGRVEAA